jgi:hypothetical protein
MRMIDADSLMTVDGYGKKINVTRVRVYQMIKEGKVKPFVISGHTFIVSKEEKK